MRDGAAAGLDGAADEPDASFATGICERREKGKGGAYRADGRELVTHVRLGW